MALNILLSNDDGHAAIGLVSLRKALSSFARVVTVAPTQDRSGVSNALTLDRPLRLAQTAPDCWTVDGTPADCVHLALTGALQFSPDIVCSGINDGANLGDDTLYSGTVGAAMEGYQFGLPSFAFSMVQKRSAHLELGASIAAQLVQRLVPTLLEKARQGMGTLLNVNIPEHGYQESLAPSINDVSVTRLGKRGPAKPAQELTDPRGYQLFWLGAAGSAMDCTSGTDFYAVAKGLVSVSPLGHDLTSHAQLELISTLFKSQQSGFGLTRTDPCA